jgi:hypothetical protein
LSFWILASYFAVRWRQYAFVSAAELWPAAHGVDESASGLDLLLLLHIFFLLLLANGKENVYSAKGASG